MVSRIKRQKGFKAAFEDFVRLVGELPGVAGIVANESPEPEFVVFFVDDLNWETEDELTSRVSDASSVVLNKHLQVEFEMHFRRLDGHRFTDYDLAACDLVHAAANGE